MILILGQAVKLASTLERNTLLLFLIPKDEKHPKMFVLKIKHSINFIQAYLLNQNVFKVLSPEKPWPIRHANYFPY